MSNVVGATGTTGNIFGFVDPIFDKYTNATIWGLLGIQLLQIHNGLIFFAIMTIMSLLYYFRGVLEIIIGYCIAFVSIGVMISLAPFFITLVLFERTKSIFNNWISSLFNYMIQPTILLVFFLLIDQLVSTQLTRTITQACWGCLIPLEILVDLGHMGIPLSFSFKLPFLSCIPFYTTRIAEIHNVDSFFGAGGSIIRLATSSLLFYIYCMMSRGLVDYVSVVASQITNVMPAKRESDPDPNAPTSATDAIMSDIKNSPIVAIGSGAVDLFKDKVINQNYRRRPGGSTGDDDKDKPDYSGKLSGQ